MEFKDVLIGRQSIREYADQPVPEEKLNVILEAARISQSGGNRQQWKFIVVRDQEKRKQLMEAANNQPHVGQAPQYFGLILRFFGLLWLYNLPGVIGEFFRHEYPDFTDAVHHDPIYCSGALIFQ